MCFHPLTIVQFNIDKLPDNVHYYKDRYVLGVKSLDELFTTLHTLNIYLADEKDKMNSYNDSLMFDTTSDVTAKWDSTGSVNVFSVDNYRGFSVTGVAETRANSELFTKYGNYVQVQLQVFKLQ